MRLKTAVITAFLIFIMVIMLGLASLNESLLKRPFDFFGNPVPLSLVLLFSLLTGFFCFGLWMAVSGIGNLVGRWLSDLKRKNEREAESWYLKGLDAALGSRPLEAVNHFKRALDAQSDYLPALLKLGDALRAAGKPGEAITWHKKALDENPEDIPTLYALTDDYLALEDHGEAKKHLLTIIRLQPKRALKALRILRNAYIREANWPKAMEVQERIGQARVLPEETAEDEPFTPGLHYQIGSDLVSQGKNREAISRLEKVRKKFPTFRSTYLKLAEAYLLDGREEEAVRTYLDGYRTNASPGCLLAMEQFYLDKNDPEGAVRQYQSLIASMDKVILPKFLLGRYYYRLELLDKARALFREIEGEIDQSGLLMYYMGRILERKGDHKGACDRYRKVIRILNPFEMTYICAYCGAFSEDWRDYCPECRRWDTYAPSFKDELMQEIQGPKPVFYQKIQWKPIQNGPSS